MVGVCLITEKNRNTKTDPQNTKTGIINTETEHITETGMINTESGLLITETGLLLTKKELFICINRARQIGCLGLPKKITDNQNSIDRLSVGYLIFQEKKTKSTLPL